MATSTASLSVFTRFHKLFLHKNGLAILILMATLKKPAYFLHWWVYFNLVMSIFFIYIYTIRDEIREHCDDSFWSNPSKDNIMKEYMEEYACVVDHRFIDNRRVYLYFIWNIILTLFLVYFLLTADRRIKFVLALQCAVDVIYFVTLAWSHIRLSLKSVMYLGLAALWVVYPAILTISLYNS